MSDHALHDWLNEEEVPGQNLPQGNMALQPQDAAPTSITNPNPEQQGPQAGQDNPTPDQNPSDEVPDLSQDPKHPDMPEDKEEMNFEQWKNSFFKESIKNDNSKLIDMIQQVRDLDLSPYQRKFVEDNAQILFLKRDANINKACEEVRKKIKHDLDQNNPSVSVVSHIHSVLQTIPELNSIFVKLQGLLGAKGDTHRKFISSITGSVQVGSGGNNEDIIYNEREYSIRISTRFNEKWGRVEIGKWILKTDDPERFLTDPELKKLEEGSPEEKDVLRRRVIMESIAECFKQRSFIVNVVGHEGTIYLVGWDIAGSLRAAYTDGKLIVRLSKSENSEVMINDEGEIIPLTDLKINYIQDTGALDDSGNPEKKELEFMQKIDGILYLTADLKTLKNAASSFTGLIFKEIPYTGNPNDLKTLQRCVPSVSEMLLRQC